MAEQLVEKQGYPVKAVCGMLDLPRSSYYYRPRREGEETLLADLRVVAGQHPTYGTRRLTHQLRRKPYGYRVNRKRIQRLARKYNLLRPMKRRKVRTTDSRHLHPRFANQVKDLEIVRPNQVWVSDITYIRLQAEFVFLAIVLDVYTRAVRGWALGRSIDQQLTLDALDMAFQHGQPEIHHSDQGVQYACAAYTHRLTARGVLISMAAIGKAEENGYAERMMRTIKEEEVDLSEYLNFGDAQHQIRLFIEDVYMTKRIHSSLGYLTPAEFEAAYQLFSSPAAVEGSPF